MSILREIGIIARALDSIANIEFRDLDLAVKLCLEASIAYVKEKGQHCCSLSLDALAYYQEKKEV